jgi:hypothetical protein
MNFQLASLKAVTREIAERGIPSTGVFPFNDEVL